MVCGLRLLLFTISQFFLMSGSLYTKPLFVCLFVSSTGHQEGSGYDSQNLDRKEKHPLYVFSSGAPNHPQSKNSQLGE